MVDLTHVEAGMGARVMRSCWTRVISSWGHPYCRYSSAAASCVLMATKATSR